MVEPGTAACVVGRFQVGKLLKLVWNALPGLGVWSVHAMPCVDPLATCGGAGTNPSSCGLQAFAPRAAAKAALDRAAAAAAVAVWMLLLLVVPC